MSLLMFMSRKEGKMFSGFNDATIRYWNEIRKENCKKVHKQNESLYLEGIKYPMEELYLDLYSYFNKVDPDLLNNKRKCISSAYNDARFSRDNPIKEYIYVRFRLCDGRKKNILGYYFDASFEGYRYGLKIYNQDARGMETIREYILDNRHYAENVIEEYNDNQLFEIQGDKYKKPVYVNESSILQDWLERKSLSFVKEDKLNDSFYNYKLRNDMCASFDSIRAIYFMLKDALYSYE